MHEAHRVCQFTYRAESDMCIRRLRKPLRYIQNRHIHSDIWMNRPVPWIVADEQLRLPGDKLSVVSRGVSQNVL